MEWLEERDQEHRKNWARKEGETHVGTITTKGQTREEDGGKKGKEGKQGI